LSDSGEEAEGENAEDDDSQVSHRGKRRVLLDPDGYYPEGGAEKRGRPIREKKEVFRRDRLAEGYTDMMASEAAAKVYPEGGAAVEREGPGDEVRAKPSPAAIAAAAAAAKAAAKAAARGQQQRRRNLRRLRNRVLRVRR
jgi:hypothetical protein